MDDFLSEQVDALVPLLVAFDAAAEEGHITRAAQVLGVPQSSLSRRLKAVEQVLGVQLFQPAGRGVSLTAQGRELHDRTRDLLRALDDAVTTVRSNADPDGGVVRFGFPSRWGRSVCRRCSRSSTAPRRACDCISCRRTARRLQSRSETADSTLP